MDLRSNPGGLVRSGEWVLPFFFIPIFALLLHSVNKCFFVHLSMQEGARAQIYLSTPATPATT